MKMANTMSPFSMAGMLAFGTSLSSRAAGRSALVDALVSMSVFLGYELWNWGWPRIQTGVYRGESQSIAPSTVVIRC